MGDMDDGTAPQPVNLRELEAMARERLTESANAYVAGGSGDEHSLG
jgi:hypothetical protein